MICSLCKTDKLSSEFYFREDSSTYRKECKACCNARMRRYYADNMTEGKAYRQQHYITNKRKMRQQNELWKAAHPGKMREYKHKWKSENRGKLNADWMLRHAAKLEATPKWLTKDHKKSLVEFYKNCPKGYHVDHIVPLRGKTVRGLHVIWNLQYLPAVENVRKGNKI